MRDTIEKRIAELTEIRAKLYEKLERAAASVNRIDGAVAALRDLLKDTDGGDDGDDSIDV